MSRTDDRGLKRNPTGTRSTDSEIDQDDLYDALNNARRRHVIRSLARHPKRDVGTIAGELAAIENDCPLSEISGEERKRVYVGLHQAHLKKLHDWGIIEWDKDRQTVTRGPVHSVAYEAMCAISEPIDEPDSVLERVRNFFAGGASA